MAQLRQSRQMRHEVSLDDVGRVEQIVRHQGNGLGEHLRHCLHFVWTNASNLYRQLRARFAPSAADASNFVRAVICSDKRQHLVQYVFVFEQRAKRIWRVRRSGGLRCAPVVLEF